jgi:hypothetical protein
METVIEFADVKPGMYFVAGAWSPGRTAFVLKKNATKAWTLIFIVGKKTELWTSTNEYNRNEWDDTWMSISQPTEPPNYHLIIAGLWNLK